MVKKGSARKGDRPASRRGKSETGGSKRKVRSGAGKRAEQARQLVLADWTRIVAGLIGKATEGGYQQAKLLFDMCEWTEDENAREDERGRAQFCDLLLEAMALLPPREECVNETAAGDSDVGTSAPEGADQETSVSPD